MVAGVQTSHEESTVTDIYPTGPLESFTLHNQMRWKARWSKLCGRPVRPFWLVFREYGKRWPSKYRAPWKRTEPLKAGSPRSLKISACGETSENSTGLSKKSNWNENVREPTRPFYSQANGTPLGWSLANALVFKRVRESLGLQRCRFTCSGAAPIMRETLEFFLSVNIPIYDIYGMSESSGE